MLVPLRGFSPPQKGLRFEAPKRAQKNGLFFMSILFVTSTHHNTTSSSCHKLIITSSQCHQIINTRQNHQKWSFFRVLKKGSKMAVFGLFLASSKITVFYTSSHHFINKKSRPQKVKNFFSRF
jgi:hypothetical protein